jgi:hypothetical protein
VLYDLVKKNQDITALDGSEQMAQSQNGDRDFMPSTQTNERADQQNHVSFSVSSHDLQLAGTRDVQLSESNSHQLNTEPIRSLYEVTKRQSFQQGSDVETCRNSPVLAADGDIITKGIISAHEAQELFD